MNTLAAASMFLLSQGAYVDTETAPYIEEGVAPNATYNGASQIDQINQYEYACEAFGEQVATILTSCPGSNDRNDLNDLLVYGE